jgi:large subunit ribosomal protein L23
MKVRDTQEGTYTFEVRVDATKDDIAKAVKAAFGVEALQVRTLIKRTKQHRRGAHLTKSQLVKKAVVTMPKGTKLPIFEEQ